MKGFPGQAWKRFGLWLIIGLLIYFLYGYRHSRLHKRKNATDSTDFTDSNQWNQ